MLTLEEQKIIEYGKASGKTMQESISALQEYRASKLPKIEPDLGYIGNKEQDVQQSFTNTQTNVGSDIDRFKAGKTAFDKGNPVLKTLETGFQISGHSLEPFLATLAETPIIKEVGQGIQWTSNQVASGFKKLWGMMIPELKEEDRVKLMAEHEKAFQENPGKYQAMAANFEAGENIIDFVSLALLEPTGKVKVNPIADTKATIRAGVDATIEAKNAVKSKVDTFVRGKTEQQILATSEKDVYKLSLNEQKIYKDNQIKISDNKARLESEALAKKIQLEKQKIADDFRTNKSKTADDFTNEQKKLDEKYQAQKDALAQKQKANQLALEKKGVDNVNKIKAETDAQAKASAQQIQDLNAEAQKAALDETLKLKPKAVRAFGEQSQTYRTLREQDMAPHKDVPLTHQEIIAKIDQVFPERPDIANDIKFRLKLKPEGSTTIGELDTQMKEMRGEKGSAAKKGNRVYTADEMNTDKALQGMSDLLKEKGVDLSRSNSFWRKWAPLRDAIVAKLKPFDTGGFQTKSFSKILIDSATEAGIHNANFIKAMEEVLGVKITDKAKAIIEKLTTKQKAMLAEKIDAEIKLADAKLKAEQGVAKLKEATETKIKSLEEKYANSQEALKRAQKESQTKLSDKARENVRKLNETNENAKRDLADAKRGEQEALQSKAFETARKGAYRRAFKNGMGWIVKLTGLKHILPFVP